MQTSSHSYYLVLFMENLRKQDSERRQADRGAVTGGRGTRIGDGIANFGSELSGVPQPATPQTPTTRRSCRRLGERVKPAIVPPGVVCGCANSGGMGRRARGPCAQRLRAQRTACAPSQHPRRGHPKVKVKVKTAWLAAMRCCACVC